MIPRGAVHAISFDYGHVLGGLDLDELAARLRPHAAGDRAPDVAAVRAAMPAAYREHDRVVALGHGHEAGWRALMGVLVAAAFGAPEDRTRDADVVEALWRAQPDRNLWRWVPPEARALLDDLAAAGVPMVITSNSEGRVRELLEEVDLARYFGAILDSGVLGYAKPDARIFNDAARSLGVAADRMVHVGDSESADVAGALGIGAFAIRFDGFVPGAAERPTRAHAQARSFAELRAALAHAIDATRRWC